MPSKGTRVLSWPPLCPPFKRCPGTSRHHPGHLCSTGPAELGAIQGQNQPPSMLTLPWAGPEPPWGDAQPCRVPVRPPPGCSWAGGGGAHA